MTIRQLTAFLPFLVTQCLNALSQAALLFFLGCGLTLIFGIMRIVNFAHGAFFMLGAYVGYSAVWDRQFLGRADRRPHSSAASAPPSNWAFCAGCTDETVSLPDGDLRPDLGHGRR